MAAASSRPGMARPRSVKRISTAPALRLRPAASRPTSSPAMVAMPTASSAVTSVRRPPRRMRASRSRPLGSVPRGWPAAPASSGSPSGLRPSIVSKVGSTDQAMGPRTTTHGQDHQQADADAQAPGLRAPPCAVGRAPGRSRCGLRAACRRRGSSDSMGWWQASPSAAGQGYAGISVRQRSIGAGAARREGAGRERAGQRGRLAVDRRQALARLGGQDGRLQERRRVGVPRRLQQPRATDRTPRCARRTWPRCGRPCAPAAAGRG